MAKQKMLTIQHVDSEHVEKLTEAEYNDLLPEIKAKYEIKETASVEVPAEVADKK